VVDFFLIITDKIEFMSSLTSSSAYKAIAALDGPVDLRKYTKIKPDVAKCLCCEADLDLSGLTDFTPQLAEAFARHHGKLILDGVTKLDVKTAQALKDHFKGGLHFGSITELDDEVAFILSQREAGDGSWKYWPKAIFPKIKKFQDTDGHLAFFKKLALDAPRYDMHVAELTEKQATILAQLKDELYYSSIETLNPEVAKALSASDQKICLTSVKHISSDVARAFAEHANELSLGNLEHVSDEVAKELSKHKGSVHVGGLKNMPDSDGYIELAKKLVADNPENLVLVVEELGEKVAEVFSTCNKPSMNSFKKLEDTAGHRKLWEKICLTAKENENLSFYSLSEIPDSFLEILSRSPANVSLNVLSIWHETPGFIAWANRVAIPVANSSDRPYIKGEFFPDKIAEIFAQAPLVELSEIAIFDSSPGNLALAKRIANESKYLRLKKISEEAAKIFAGGTNTRYEVGDLVEVNEGVFEALLGNKNHIYLSNITSLADGAAKYCEGDKSLGFPKLEKISLELATSFGKGKGSLNLSGLCEVDSSVLQELVKREGELTLDGLKSLNLEQAKIFSQGKGNLVLGGIEDISDDVLDTLLDLDPSRSLNLKSLKSLSEANALKLSKRGGSVNLTGLVELPETDGHVALAQKLASAWRLEQPKLVTIGPLVANALATNSHVKLPALAKLDVDVARGLAKTKTLCLNSLNEASLDIAKELSVLAGELELGYVDNIGDDAFTELCKNKTKLMFWVKELSVGKATAIASIPSLYIEGLEEVSADAAKCFKGYKGDIYMSKLCRLSSEAAKELRKLKSKLSTNRTGEHALATGL
jgi:hypothetical protein